MEVSSCLDKEQNTIIKRKIKLLLVDHFHDQGFEYKNILEEEEEEEKREVKNSVVNGIEEEKGQELKKVPKDIKKDKKDKKKNKSKDKVNGEIKKQNCFDHIREKVSTTKYRFNNSDFNLDLTYITNRIIACGFPAEGMEALYRNKKEDLVRFFQTYHGSMAKVYNLCAE